MKKFFRLGILLLLISAFFINTFDFNIYAETATTGTQTNTNKNKNSNQSIVKNDEEMKLTVRTAQTITIGEGGSAAVEVIISNNSNISVKRLTAQAYIKDPDKAYIEGDGIIKEISDSIPSQTGRKGYFYIKTDANFSSKTVPVDIKLRYYIEDSNKFKEQSETVYVRVDAPEKPVNPAIEIAKVEGGWINEIEAGKIFQVPFEVKNTGDALAKNIKLSLEGLESGGVTLANGLSTIDITSLSPGQSTYVIYNLKTDKKTPEGAKLLTIKYSFSGDSPKTKEGTQGPQTSPSEGTYQFSIDIKKPKTEDMNVEFQDITFPNGSIGRNTPASISFTLVNKGKTNLKKLVVSANSQDQTGLASKSVSQINAKDLKAGEKRKFTFDFISTPSAETKNYPVELKASFVDEKSEEAGEISQMAGIFVKAPKEKDPNEKGERPVPKLIIEEYSFNPDIIEAGKPFNMYLTFYNTNSLKAVKNIKIFLTSDVQESAVGGDTSTNQNGSSTNTSTSHTSTSASVFTPKGTSNTFYIDSIAPGARVEKEITLTTVPDTAAKTYTVIANFEYEDAEANKYTATEQIGVPVVQQAKLEIGEIVPQGDFMVGSEVPVSVDFYNTGKAQLYNVMVKASGEGLTFDTPSYYKGNFAPGSSDNFTVNVNPLTEGNKTLKLSFSFEDSTGNVKTLEREYEFNPQNMAMDEGMPEDMNVPQRGGLWKKILGGILILALIGGGGFFLKKRHDRKTEDEDLEI
ncbi:hypothetical protein [uncultured Peptoniphilus sp.]|uniref:COG1361 S-layer family protein n=1 Tax=uncultured Peptoniphilus sp. TaxID=254354 RepID=UPI002806028C|nr:hypothetical protein [uncultured Peptoniphilus sp.]